MHIEFLVLCFIIQNSIEASSSTLRIKEQGIYSHGGSVLHSEGTFEVSNYYTSRAGSTLHADHANVLYQIPDDETRLPI